MTKEIVDFIVLFKRGIASKQDKMTLICENQIWLLIYTFSGPSRPAPCTGYLFSEDIFSLLPWSKYSTWQVYQFLCQYFKDKKNICSEN